MRPAAAAAVLATLALAAPAGAGEPSIRCAGGLVQVGDPTIDLLGKCGVPALREPTVDDAYVASRLGSAVRRSIVTTIERWTYDFGPRQFLMIVTLQGGRVTSIDRGGYGYARSVEPDPVPLRRAACEPSAIRLGLSKLDLLARCGEPVVVYVRPYGIPVGLDPGEEVWTYDFGPQTFVRLVVLDAGIVTRIDVGSWGYARP